MTDRELMQQALDALEGYARNCTCEGGGAPCDAAEALRARLAQPEQEPVAWLYKKKDGMQVITDDPDYADGTWIPLYTAPSQREWQGLTENEIKHLWYEACQTNLELTSQLIVHLARNIEAKLKEKNHDQRRGMASVDARIQALR